MKRLAVVAIGALVASMFALVPGGNAGAQSDEDFTINPTEGPPGTEVQTQVDQDALEEECAVTAQALDEMFDEILAELGPLSALNPVGLEATVNAILGPAFDAIVADASLQAQFLANTLVLAFVDIVNQQPQATDTFGPDGAGSIVVPDVDPGIWAIAAVCAEPQLDAESVQAAMAAGVAVLTAHEIDGLITFGTLVITNPALAQQIGGEVTEAVLGELMGAGPTWVQTFVVPPEWPGPDPAVAAFCAVLPQLQPLGAEIVAALAALPEDDGTMTDQQWAQAHDWDAIGAELRELFEAAVDLISEGDEARPNQVADAWEAATAGLRDAWLALQTVDYDLSSPTGRTIAGELRAGATADDDDPAADDPTAVLTQWFLDNCVPPTPVPGETPRAPAAQPVTARPTFAG